MEEIDSRRSKRRVRERDTYIEKSNEIYLATFIVIYSSLLTHPSHFPPFSLSSCSLN
jgi:hypothetical protein